MDKPLAADGVEEQAGYFGPTSNCSWVSQGVSGTKHMQNCSLWDEIFFISGLTLICNVREATQFILSLQFKSCIEMCWN